MTLIKNTTIIDHASTWHGQTVDIHVKGRKILAIGPSLDIIERDTIEGEELCTSHGWIDIGGTINDPGHEHHEQVEDFIKAATNGGYAMLAPFANTRPAMDSKVGVKLLHSHKGIQFFPIANISENGQGKELSEIHDLSQAGASGFSDGVKSIKNIGLIHRALQYAQPTHKPLLVWPSDETTVSAWQMHEGKTSTSLGMKGLPEHAEVSAVHNLLQIKDYTNGNLAFYGISTQKALAMVKDYQKKNEPIPIIVPYLNLIFTDEDLINFDTSLKVCPPLRSKADQKSLKTALKEGLIKVISSNHVPLDQESKDLEFEYAHFGAAGIETVFAGLNTLAKDIATEDIIKALTYGPAQLLQIELPAIEEGSELPLTVFDKKATFTYMINQGLAMNNPLHKRELQGVIKRVIA